MKSKRMMTPVLSATVLAVLSGPVFGEKLPSDTRILTDTLANGVTWKFREHDNPPGKMAIMIHVATGSLNETDEQKGLAHFIEHMCFNGTEHFAPGELIPYFESIGMEFGADLNAFTSFDQTAYMLFTPNTDIDQISKALMVLSDYAFRAQFINEEIDKERGVVLEESRAGKNAFQRIRDKLWPELFAGTRFATRLPIGTDETLKTINRDQFVDYYRTWYRPENLTVVLVGDAKPDKIIPLIKKWFGEYRPEKPARKEHGPEFKQFKKQRAMVVTDPELASGQVQMLDIDEGRPATTTEALWRTDLVESVGSWILGRRYDELVNKGEASFRGAGVGVSNFFNDAVLVSGSASGEPNDWSKMLEELVIEVSRADEFGFSQRELDLAKKEMLADAERAVRTEPTRNARGIIMGIVSAVNNDEPVLSAQQELDLYEKMLPELTLSDVNASFKKNFTPGTFAYVVTLPDKKDVDIPESDDVLAAARAAWARKLKPFDQDQTPTELLATLPTPGSVIESTTDKDLGITSLWLSNGVRVHHRFMDYKKDSVLVNISLAGGSIEETEANSGISQVAAIAVNEAATSRLTSTNMRDLMTGKNISVGAGPAEDSLTIRVSGSPKDLETGLQEAHALLTDGKIEESAFKNWRLNTLRQVEMLEKMPRFKAVIAVQELLSGNDPRQRFWTKDLVEAINLSEAQAWFNRLCKSAPIEVSIVGEMKLDDVMPLIEKYIGSLPKRSRSAGYLDKLRRLSRSTGPLSKHIDVETVTPQAMGVVGFAGCEAGNTHDRRALELASHILSSRAVKRIREELSIVYSIGVRSQSSWAYKDSGAFLAGAPCDPDNVEQLATEVRKLFKEFGENGPTAEELTNAKKQVAENLDTQMKEPRYWSGVLSHLDLHHRSLDDEKAEKTAYEPFTAKQVRAVFDKYNTPARQFEVTAVPTLAPTADKKEKADSPAS